MPRRVDVTLSEEDREVLERWARRPKSAQALALRCRIVLAGAEGCQSKEIAGRLGSRPRPSGAGGAVSRAVASTVCTTSPGPASHARSPTRRSSG